MNLFKRNKKRDKTPLNDAYALEKLIQELNKDPSLKATLTTVDGTKIVLETVLKNRPTHRVNWELNQ